VDERAAWAIARQTAAALAHAAAHGVVHRDIKPANLFLVPAPLGVGLPADVPLVKVMDFGLALTRHAMRMGGDTPTEPDVVAGTPMYMAPEQHRKAPDLDHRADIYALGVTTLYALTGRSPFAGPSVWEVMEQKHLHALQLTPALSRKSVELLKAMTVPNPDKRIGNYDELIARIEQLPAMRGLAIRSWTAKSRSGSPGRWRSLARFVRARWPWFLAGSCLVAGAAGALWFAGQPPTVAPIPPVRYEPTGHHEALFESGSISRWLPPAAGGTWQIEPDDEGLAVFTGSGFTRRVFRPVENFRVTIGLDVHEAAAAEVHFAIPAANPDAGRRFVLRVTRTGGAVFGSRDGDRGGFHPTGEAVPFPPAAWLKDRRPYLEVKLERAGNRWAVSFNGRAAGEADDDGRPKAPELRLAAEGGRARIDSVILTTLKRRD
jgi:hypothetical protein